MLFQKIISLNFENNPLFLFIELNLDIRKKSYVLKLILSQVYVRFMYTLGDF